MRQRVSLGRALLYGGEILLLDEPLKGLDTATRNSMMELILEYSRGSLVIAVTHSPEEAMRMADRIILFSGNPLHVRRDQPVQLTERQRQEQDPVISTFKKAIFDH
jgi:ABC-type nitrate/sulfonate/bicarbonate transport system ATPase subunit